jgi:TonB family protein
MTLNDIIGFIYESGICLAVLFTMYWLFLRRETYFQFNRFYLLAILAVAFTFPLGNLALFKNSSELSALGSISGIADAIRLPEATITSGSSGEHMLSTNWKQLALMIYLAGVFLLMARIIFGTIRVIMLKRRGKKILREGYTIVYLEQAIAPFSFFRTIYLNDQLRNTPGERYIINHEIIHLKQLHSFDNLFVEICLSLFWFNPFMWLLRGAIRDTHEYLADNGVLIEKTNRTTYQTLLLKQTIGLPPIVLTNSFNSAIKNRIIMMCKNRSSILAKFKPLLLLPVTGMLFLLFACSEKEELQPVASDQELQARDKPDVNENEMKDEMSTMSSPQDTNPQNGELFYIVEEMPEFNGGDPAVEFRKYIGQNLRYPESAEKDGISGRVIVQFTVNKEGYVVDPVVVRSASPELDREAIRVVSSSPRWTPGKQHGKAVAVLFTFPLNFVLE